MNGEVTADDDERCVSVAPQSHIFGEWLVERCDETRPFICEFSAFVALSHDVVQYEKRNFERCERACSFRKFLWDPMPEGERTSGESFGISRVQVGAVEIWD